MERVPPHYTTRDVAEILRVSEVTLLHWRKRSVGPAWVKLHGAFRYPFEAFHEYLERIGPIPVGATTEEKRQFFIKAHKPELTAEDLAGKAALAKLADIERRLVVAEATLALNGGRVNG